MLCRSTLADHGHERGKHDRIFAGIDVGQRGEVGRNGTWAGIRGGFCPSIYEQESHVANERGKHGSDVGMSSRWHGQSDPIDAASRGDRFLCDDKAVRANRTRHLLKNPCWLFDVHQEKSAKGEVHGLGKREVFTCLGDRNDLSLPSGSRARSDKISSSRVAVDRVNPAVASYERGEGCGYVSRSGADIDAPPIRTDADSL